MKHDYLFISSPSHLRMYVPLYSSHTHLLCGPLFDFCSVLWLHSLCVWCGLFACPCDVAICGFWSLLVLWSGLCLVIRVAMGKEQQESKRAIRNSQLELSEQSAVSILIYRTALKRSLFFNLWINIQMILSSSVEMCGNVSKFKFCVISIQGPDVLSEPSEGGRTRELKAAASSQRAEWGIPRKACVLFAGHSCESQHSHMPNSKVSQTEHPPLL